MRVVYTMLLALGLVTSALAFDRYPPDPRDSTEYPVIDLEIT